MITILLPLTVTSVTVGESSAWESGTKEKAVDGLEELSRAPVTLALDRLAEEYSREDSFEAVSEGAAIIELKVRVTVKVVFENEADTNPTPPETGTGVAVAGTAPQVPLADRISGVLQVRHSVGAGPEQVAQVGSHALQNLAATMANPGAVQAEQDWVIPFGSASRYPVAQVVQLVADPVQLEHGAEHGRQVFPLEYVPAPHGTQVLLVALRKKLALQAVQLVLVPVQLRQFAEQGEQPPFPLLK